MMIVHLTTQNDWKNARRSGEVRTESLETEGFIHCSTPQQIVGVANNFYKGVPNLVLLWIDPERVQADVRWEPPIHPATKPWVSEETVEKVADGTVDLFPHIYGPLNLEAIIQVVEFLPDADGVFRRVPFQ